MAVELVLGVPYVKTYKDPANLSPARDTAGANLGDIIEIFKLNQYDE